MIPLLEPVFRGDLAVYGETLAHSVPPPAGCRPVSSLIDDPALLGRLLERHARSLGGGDSRATASAWSMSYLHALLPPVVAALGLLRHGLPVGPADLHVRFGDADGRALRFHAVDLGRPCRQAGTPDRFGPLLHDHLGPLFVALGRSSGLPPAVPWSNAVRDVVLILDRLGAGNGNSDLAEDRRLLLDTPVWPDGRANPLGAPGLRRCCLNHRLPGRSRCHACPAAPAAHAGRRRESR